MKTSIVIPTYNHCADLLKPCLESIERYTDPNIEVIVVANGCTDETRQYVESLGEQFILLWHEEKLGYVKAANIGIKAAKGDYVVLLNNDVVLLSQKENRWIEILQRPFADKEVGLTGVSSSFSEETNSDFFCFYCVMIKKAVLDQIGLLDEIFSPGFGEDVDCCKKIELAGYKLVNCSTIDPYTGGYVLGDFPIYHPASSTFNDAEHIGLYQKLMQRNKLLLKNRYLGEKLRLNMGSGDDHIDGFLGIDLYDKRSDLQIDMKKLPFANESVREIVSYHSVEHINPYEFNEVLREWHRLLIPGGRLTIEIPDILEVFKDFESADKQKRYDLLNTVYGYGEHKGQHHYWGWYDEILIDHLVAHGFTNCIRTEPKTHLTPNKKHYAMRIEANKFNPIKYSIVIPTYNHLEDCLKPCLESIKQYTNLNNVEVLVVANGCTDDTKSYVESLGAPFKLLWIPEQAGFVKAINKGMMESKGEYVILLNNDTCLLGHNWIEILEKPFTDPGMGITGPLQINCCYASIQYVMFFCAMIKRNVIDAIGFLDERYGMGMIDDQDYCLRAIKAGFKLMQVPEPYGNPIVNLQKNSIGNMDVGGFPIYHKSNITFPEVTNKDRNYIKKNMHILLDVHYPDEVVYIIVPTYRRYSMLKEALTSILNQTYKKIRVFVVSDGPDDKVRSIVDDFNSFKINDKFNYILFEYMHLNEHEGALGGRVRMLGVDSLPERGYVCFLDDDNLLHPTYVEKLHSAIGQEANISYCQIDHSHLGIIPLNPGLRVGEIDSLNYMVANSIAKKCKNQWIHDPKSTFITHDFDFINACSQYTKANFVPEILGVHRRTETGYTEVPAFDIKQLEQQDTFIFNEIFVGNVYGVKPEEVKNSIIVDIGGNIGMFSIFSIFKGAKKCYCIEPNKKNYQTLIENIKTFPDIVPLYLAISKPGLKKVHIILADGSCQVREDGEGDPVDCISLDELLKQIPFNEDLVMKIDCEGSEYDIMFNCTKESLRRFKYIYAEVHNNMHLNKDYNYDMFEKFMNDNGFESEKTKAAVLFGVWYYDENGNPVKFIQDPLSSSPPSIVLKFTRVEKKPKVYDCFTFFNEFDLLELRLNELNDVVDYFVLAEATKTHSGKDKPLYFAENKERFAKFLPKIKHVVVDFPETYDTVAREKYQRDQIIVGLRECKPDDIIILSDIDEIVNADAVRQYSPEMGICAFQMRLFYYFLDCAAQQSWIKTRIFPFGAIKNEEEVDGGIDAFRSERDNEFNHVIDNGGWHFSFLGSAEDISYKIDSYLHQELANYNTVENIQESITQGRDIFHRNIDFGFVEIDNSYPKYVLENLDKYRTKGLVSDKALLERFKKQDEPTWEPIFGYNGYGIYPEEIKDRIIIDIGGNKGYFAVYSILHGAKKCYCIEPNKESYQLLLENIKTFPNIIPINLAMSKPGLERAHIMLDGVHCQVHEDGEGELVDCVSLDDFLKQLPSNEDLVMKMDCEGSEYDIIFNCTRESLRRFKCIYAEVHNDMHSNKSYNYDMFEAFMNHMGFESEEIKLPSGMSSCLWIYGTSGEVIDCIPWTQNKQLKFIRIGDYLKNG